LFAVGSAARAADYCSAFVDVTWPSLSETRLPVAQRSSEVLRLLLRRPNQASSLGETRPRNTASLGETCLRSDIRRADCQRKMNSCRGPVRSCKVYSLVSITPKVTKMRNSTQTGRRFKIGGQSLDQLCETRLSPGAGSQLSGPASGAHTPGFICTLVQ